MTLTEALQNHLILCDDLYQLALEENRFLKTHARVPEAALLDRKRAILARLDTSLSALKQGAAEIAGAPRGAAAEPSRKEIIEKARSKILQILHLDRENEQLLLRYSLNVRPGAGATAAPVTAAPSSLVQRLYDRHT